MDYVGVELRISTSYSIKESVAVSTFGAQTVDILVLMPGNDACIFMRGIQRSSFLHTVKVGVPQLKHKYTYLNATPSLRKMRKLHININTLSAELTNAA